MTREWISGATACIVVILTIALSCGTETSPVPQEAESAGEDQGEPGTSLREDGEGAAIGMVNRIVFVGRNGGLFTIDPDGSNRLSLTGGTRIDSEKGGVLAQGLSLDTQYYWPTWAPDGSKVAASRVTVGGSGPEVSLEVFDSQGGGVTTVYRNITPSLIAEGAPHYLYWSPDSSNLAFLVSAPQAFALVVADTDLSGGEAAPERATLVETGAPLYFHWSPTGSAILLHGRDELKLAREPFATGPVTLQTVGYGFRAPAFSPDGERVAYTVVDSGGLDAGLVVSRLADGGSVLPIMDVGPLAAFAWSPVGDALAVADHDPDGRPGLQRLVVVPASGGRPRVVAEEAITAFFWSPVGDRLAWFAVNPEERLFELKVFSIESDEEVTLFRFRPSSDLVTMLSFFDQYAYSHSLWSPDGQQLVVAGVKEEPFARRNGGSARGESVFVVDASGREEPRELTEGSLAFWSWN